MKLFKRFLRCLLALKVCGECVSRRGTKNKVGMGVTLIFKEKSMHLEGACMIQMPRVTENGRSSRVIDELATVSCRCTAHVWRENSPATLSEANQRAHRVSTGACHSQSDDYGKRERNTRSISRRDGTRGPSELRRRRLHYWRAVLDCDSLRGGATRSRSALTRLRRGCLLPVTARAADSFAVHG